MKERENNRETKLLLVSLETCIVRECSKLKPDLLKDNVAAREDWGG
jgi:hypothetical protein